MKRFLKIGVGVAVTLFLFWLVLKDEDPRAILAAMLDGDPWLLLASVVLVTITMPIRAIRWNVILQPVLKDSSFDDRLAATSIHFMVNNLVPLRVGEFARAYVLSRIQPVTASAAFGSVVVMRFLDGAVLLVLLIVPVFMPGFPEVDAFSGDGALVFRAAVTGVFAVLAVLVVMATMPKVFMTGARIAIRLAPQRSREPILTSLESFLESLSVLRDPVLMLKGTAWTVFLWLWMAASFWLGMMAFGIETGYWSAVFTCAVVAFIMALPAAPGGFGNFHFGIRVALADVYGVAAEPVVAYAFAYHFGGWLPITFLGLYYLSKLGLSLGEVGGGSGDSDGPPVDVEAQELQEPS